MDEQQQDATFQKRVRRRVTARRHDFFVAIPPGFEGVTRAEIDRLNISTEAVNSRIESGGISFQGRVHDAYAGNLYLATANRILMRIFHFRATNFRQMEKQLGDIDWELYLPGELPFSVHVSLHHCRLYHSGAVTERVADSIRSSFRKKGRKDHFFTSEATIAQQRIFIRGKGDKFQVSLDTSGEHLHKRGLRTAGGTAPIRETIAAAILLLAGYTGKQVLLDPMCGSGTFSLEAARISGNIPPGWFRRFSFESWPAFRPKRWEDIRRRARQRFRSEPPAGIYASDINKGACDLLEKSLLAANLEAGVAVACEDFFSLDPGRNGNEKGIVVVNPPYGIRLGNRKASGRLYYRLVEKLSTDFQGWKAAVIAPDRKLAANTPFASRRFAFTSGGLKLTLVVGTI